MLKKIIPAGVIIKYHYFLAKISAIFYGYPSNKMLVIGVTGTSGKSSTSYFIAQILESAGLKVGLTSTTLFKIGSHEWLNDKKMTMLGRAQTQKILAQMLKEKCQVAIIETSSQGIEQFRHIGINYDILVFTNLYPEHIEAHGGFENYKKAKGKLFAYLMTQKNKKLTINNQPPQMRGKQLTIKKTIIINSDDEYSDYFLQFNADEKITFDGKKKYNTNLLGNYNIYNINAAVAVAETLGINSDLVQKAVADLKPLPGRLEFIENNRGIKILVDYAFEPKALEKLYQITKEIPHQKIIHVLGSTGGGRDKARRPILGKIAAENADIIIITNEDPYEEEPMNIIEQVAVGAVTSNFSSDRIYKILDRREAMAMALKLAEPNDLVLITGKGAEQAMCIKNGQLIPWDDRQVIREELTKI